MAKFDLGQIVHHTQWGYRAVILSVDESFEGSDEWYAMMASSRAPRDVPWYHLLVDDSDAEEYVAESHLRADDSIAPVAHPLVEIVFDELRDGRYHRTRLLS